MTKKLLLSAVAAGVMAFAGAAAAGELTSATVGGSSTGTYTVARDYALPAAGLRTQNTNVGDGELSFTFSNTANPIVVASNTDYIVTLTLSGPAKFVDQAQTAISLGGQATTVTPIVSADGKTLTVYAKTATVAGTPVLNSIVADGFNLHVTGQETVSVAYKLQQVVGSQTLDLDTSSSKSVIEFKNALTMYDGTARSVLAALPDFESFEGLANQAALVSSTYQTKANTNYFIDLDGHNVPNASAIITGYSATVTGPQIEDMLTTFDGQSIDDATNVTATSATFGVVGAGGSPESFDLVLTPAEDTAISEGVYSVAISPTYAQSWTGPATINKNVVSVGLAGTNFYAPWFGFGGSAATSTLRIANNGAGTTGNIVVQLRARNGSTATATSVTFPGVAGHSFRSITGAELRQAFGTDAANADLLVSIQSQAYGSVSAKVRTIQPSGQIMETSLGLLEAPVTAQAVQDGFSSIRSQITTSTNDIRQDIGDVDTAVTGVSAQVTDVQDSIDNLPIVP